MTETSRIDPVTVSVVQGALETIAVEVGYKLMRMAYSSIIRDRRISARR
ncbi:hydantoinase B/oxoprolinase family protein [Teichococcus aestuarii]